MTEEIIKQWAIVEVMGHQRYAGEVSEYSLGGSNFLRVDVPAFDDHQAFTKLFGPSSIYAITFVSEETAQQAARGFLNRPIDEWCAREYVRQADKLIEQRPEEQNRYEGLPW